MAMAEAIIQNCPNNKITILSSPAYIENDKKRYSIYPNVQLLPIPWFSGNKIKNVFKLFFSLLGIKFYKSFRRELNQSDYLIDISGDSISNDYGTKSIFFQLFPILIAHKNIKILFAPQSLGPFKGFIQNTLVKKAFKKAQKINLRETESKKYLKNFSNYKFEDLADLAFLLKATPIKLNISIKEKTIAVGVSALVKDFGVANSSLLFKHIIDKCLEKGYHVLLVNHVSTPQGNDILVANTIKEKYFNNDERVIKTNKNFRASEWKYLISQCSGIISARMHPVVHALSLSIPSLNLSYNHKSVGVVEKRFAPYGQIASINDDDVLVKVDFFLDGLNLINQKDFKDLAQKNISLAQRFINQIV